jgi:hypothetical protein
MGAPTTPYKIYHKGYQISGDVRSGYRATVPYFMLWADAFAFADAIFGTAHAVTQGPITWSPPFRFPATVAPMYAQRFTIEPMGLDKGGNPITQLKGLRPGEYWTHALVNVEFETPTATQQIQDDRNGQNQLDPANPVTMCEQSVKIAGKMQTHKGGSYVYFDGKPVVGDVGIPTSEARLVLSFPRVPYLPWGIIRPYMNKINDVAILGCDRGTLLLTGMDTKTVVTNEGYGQQAQLEFADNGAGLDWNMLPRNGAYELVRQKGQSWNDTNRIFKYIDFRSIFAKLTYA